MLVNASGAPRCVTISLKVVFPGTIKTTSCGSMRSLTVTLVVLINPQPVTDSSPIRMPVASQCVLFVAGMSVAKRPELKLELLGALPKHHIINDTLLVEEHIQVVAFDIHAGKVYEDEQ